MPIVDLGAPGWQVREGQGVWRLPNGSTELAGEILVATGADRQGFVQFSKSPFPLVVAQSAGDTWRIEFPPQKRSYAGRGQPPKRLLWLYLPRVLAGNPPPRDCAWTEHDDGWRMENHKTGETIEGYFTR